MADALGFTKVQSLNTRQYAEKPGRVVELYVRAECVVAQRCVSVHKTYVYKFFYQTCSRQCSVVKILQICLLTYLKLSTLYVQFSDSLKKIRITFQERERKKILLVLEGKKVFTHKWADEKKLRFKIIVITKNFERRYQLSAQCI